MPADERKTIDLDHKKPLWVKALAARGDAADVAREALLAYRRKRPGHWAVDEEGLKVQAFLAKLSDKQQIAFAESLFPAMAPTVRRAMVLAAQVPVTPRWTNGRRAFRSPGDGARLAETRGRFLSALTYLAIEPDYTPEQILTAPVEYWHDATWPLALLFAAHLDVQGESAPFLQQLVGTMRAATKPGHVGNLFHPFMLTSNPAAWDTLLDILKKSGRDEGVRQAIFEMADEGDPSFFPRFLRRILDDNLLRFSSAARAVDVWFGLAWDSASTKPLTQAVELTLAALEDPAAQRRMIEKGSALEAYFALWAANFVDLREGLPLVRAVAGDRHAERRYAAVHIAASAHLAEFRPVLAGALGDDDDRVVARGLLGLRSLRAPWDDDETRDAAAFATLEKLIHRFPRKTKIKHGLWPWTAFELDPAVIGSEMVRTAGDKELPRLLASYGVLDADGRRGALARSVRLTPGDAWRVTSGGAKEKKPIKLEPVTGEARRLFLEAMSDSSSSPRDFAFAVLSRFPLAEDETAALEDVLKRKNKQARAAALGRLLSAKDEDVLACASRLLKCKDRQQQGAGVELLRSMSAAGRAAETADAQLGTLADGGGKPGGAQAAAARAIDAVKSQILARADCFGLCAPEQATAWRQAATQVGAGRKLVATSATWQWLAQVAMVLDKHRGTPIPQRSEGSSEELKLLGELEWTWSLPRWETEKSIEQNIAENPIAADLVPLILEPPKSAADADGLQMIRAKLLYGNAERVAKHLKSLGIVKLAAKGFPREAVLEWAVDWVFDCAVAKKSWPAGASGALLDGVEHELHANPAMFLKREGRYEDEDKVDLKRPELIQHAGRVDKVLSFAEEVAGDAADAMAQRQWAIASAIRAAQEAEITPAQRRALQQPDDGDRRDNLAGVFAAALCPSANVVYRGIVAGWLSDADVIEWMLGEFWGYWNYLDDFTRKGPRTTKYFKPGPELLAAAARFTPVWRRVMERLVQAEIARGEAMTPATPFAMGLVDAGGMDHCVALVQALGKDHVHRVHEWREVSRPGGLTQLILRTTPEEGDTPERFGAAVKAAAIDEQHLLQLAVYAPQWSAHVEHALGWPGLRDAVWWIHAHTKGEDWRRPEEISAIWDSHIAERTPIERDDLMAGAVDADWFRRTVQTLGPKRWGAVYENAKYATGGTGHKRAQLFADAIIGVAKEKDLVERLLKKRHQDAARALGLLPLKPAPAGDAKAEAARRKQILDRYRTLVEFKRTSAKAGGSMKQASEKRAYEIGLDNLARNAGYVDPLRLQWAMEIELSGDLSEGARTARAGEVTVSLSVDAEGIPGVSIEKNGKTLVSVPSAAKKDAKITALLEQARELKRQVSRVRQSLEQAMCRGDAITGAELAALARHPLLWPMLQRLVLVAESDATLIGYPAEGGRVLRAPAEAAPARAGKRKPGADAVEPLKGADRLRIAHPIDLLATKQWSEWQRDCFAAERVQPFKQVFRELYVPTDTERRGAARGSTRYSGHQLQPRQAMAILGKRGWIARPDEGIGRTFHAERLTAWVEFEETFYSPAEIEGLTLRSVRFNRSGDFKEAALGEVPPRIFSEVMRDIDLIVSVAHRSGVDPEASESSIEARAALVRETARLLKLGGVRTEQNRAMITGTLGDYSVHLGSGTIHMLPGGAVWVVPVHAAHRGRIFLPFADEDPKTAEIISKVLLLARDAEIMDPSIIEQIKRR